MIWLLTTVQQGLLFSVTVFTVGCVAWRIGVAPGASADLGEESHRLLAVEASVVRWIRACVALLVVAWGLRMVVQVMAFRDPFAPLRDDVSLLLFQTSWGTVWIGQGALLVVLLGTVWGALRVPHGGGASSRVTPVWWLLGALVVALTASLAMSGHAMGVDTWRALAVSADALHTLAAGVWIGTLAVILLASGGIGMDEPRPFGAQIRRFSPMALVAGGAVVAMGAALSWTHLTAISDLWTTGYGRVLMAKVTTVLVILALGFVNWRRGVPSSDSEEGARSVRRRGGLEVGLAAVVIVLTAILVHSTKP